MADDDDGNEPQQFSLLEDEFYDVSAHFLTLPSTLVTLCRSRVTSINAAALTRTRQDPEKLSQLLAARQRAGTHVTFQFTPSPKKKPQLAAGRAEESPQQHVAPPSPRAPVAQPALDPTPRPTPRRVPTATRNVRSNLSRFHSAPTSTGNVMEREGVERMYQSFADVMGDTQPDSQIYRQWTSGIFDSASMGTKNATSLFDRADEEVEDADTPTDGLQMDGSSQSQNQSQQQRSDTITNPTIVHDDEPETQFRTDGPLTSPLKFETPAMAGHKRDNQGEMLSSGMRTATTPGTALNAAAFFPTSVGNGGIGNAMSLTQIFNATQAHTSPIVGAPSDDAVFQRPSPNFTNGRRSSPVGAMSSPTKAPRSEAHFRSSSEPRAEYVTMKQSQERRSRNNLDAEEPAAEQDSWEEPTMEQRLAERRRAKEQFDREAGRSFKKVTAPSLLSPAVQRKKGRTPMSLLSTPMFKTPATVRRSRRNAYDGPYDDESEDEPDELSQTPLVHENVGDAESSDELSQGVSSKARPAPVKAHNKKDQKIQVPNTSSHPQRTLSGRSTLNSPLASPSEQLQLQSHARVSASQPLLRASRPKSSKESVIVDSQPDVTANSDGAPRPKSLLPSSPSENQYSVNQTTVGGRTGYTSQVVSSSMPPMPPSSSSQSLGDAEKDDGEVDGGIGRVPSSPPALNGEDIVYDEHDYEGHRSARGSDVVISREHSIDRDTNPEANDAIPESEHVDNQEEDMELDEPRSPDVDPNDDEVPETAEEEQPEEELSHEDQLVMSALIRSSQPGARKANASRKPIMPSRVQRQSTVPDSDRMEDTQPTLFAHNNVIGHSDIRTTDSAANDSATANQTLSTEPFHTAQEHETIAVSNKDSNNTSKSGEPSASDNIPRFRSLNDIANQPDSQLSTDPANIEIPHLSIGHEMDNDYVGKVSESSPMRPAKKRKITYSTRKMTFQKPAKDSGTEPERSSSTSLDRSLPTVQEAAPSSTMEREEQGALAAANARENVARTKLTTSIPSASSNSRKTKPQKKGALKPVDRTLLEKSPTPTRTTRRSAKTKSSKRSTKATEAKQVDVEMADVDNTIDKSDGLASATSSSPSPPEASATIENVTDRGEAPAEAMLAPRRVFAFWPGQGYFPATCIGYAGSHHLQVRYDDGTLNTLDSGNVRALDLRIGDKVKVDEPGMKKNAYVVVGFKDKIDTNHKEEYPLADQHGYSTIVLEVKQRESMPKAGVAEEQEAISVPLRKIYLTNILWAKYNDRPYEFAPSSSPTASTSRIGTPVVAGNRLGTPTISRRGTAGPSMLREILRAGSVPSSTRGGDGTVFANMAFAITLTQDSDDAAKKVITKLITSNGGYVLDHGLNELFEDLKTSDVPTSPAKSSAKGRAKARSKARSFTTSGAEELILKEESKDLQFVALITDTHSRRTKYVQALALNVPCLHHRWLSDSIAASIPLPFGRYLLPAGISKYLEPEGVIRSRTMQLYDPGGEGASFKEIIKGRPLLLHGQSVLIVMGKSSKEPERMNPYLFLTHALGPHTVERCADLASARDMLKRRSWDWVFVDGGLAEPAHVLFGETMSTPLEAKGRKRKRDNSEEPKPPQLPQPVMRVGNVDGKQVRLACDEFIVQSLIVGALLDEHVLVEMK